MVDYMAGSMMKMAGHGAKDQTTTGKKSKQRPNKEGRQRRSFLHVVFLQVMIRLRHLLESWFYLKPLFCNMSGYRSFMIPRDMPEADLGTQFCLRVCIITSTFLRALPQTLLFIALKLRIMHTVNWVYVWLLQRVANQMEKANFDWSRVRGMPVPEYDMKKGSPDEFFNTFEKIPHPVVLKGFLKDSNLLEKYQFDKFIEKYGDETVLLQKDGLDGIPGLLKEVNNGSYLKTSEILLKKHQHIQDDINECLKPLEAIVRRKCSFSQMFMGKKGTGSPLHFANTHNVFLNIEGNKKWHLMDPYFGHLQSPFYILGLAAHILVPSYPEKSDTNPAFKYEV